MWLYTKPVVKRVVMCGGYQMPIIIFNGSDDNGARGTYWFDTAMRAAYNNCEKWSHGWKYS